MAKLSEYTLNQVGGPNGQVLVQELVYGQKDFWTLQWSNTSAGDNGWDQTVEPINLSNATITAQIIRRQVTAQKDTRCGLDLTIEDYPTPSAITSVTATDATSDLLTADSTAKLFIDEPVQFTGAVFGGPAINTTYYVNDIPTATEFSVSNSVGGGSLGLSTATGTMVVNRIAPTAISLPISNISTATGTFTVGIDVGTWGLNADDPELDINATFPIAYTGYIKISFPAQGSQPAYDNWVFLLFLVNSNGVQN